MKLGGVKKGIPGSAQPTINIRAMVRLNKLHDLWLLFSTKMGWA